MRQLENWLDAYLEYVSNTEPAELYHYWTGLSALSAALQRKCLLRMGFLRFYPNLYVVLVGPPANRKNDAINIGLDLITNIPSIIQSSDSLTRQAMVDQFMEAETCLENICHSSVSVFAREFMVFLNSLDQQFVSALTDWFDCGRGEEGYYVYRTRGRKSELVKGVYLSILGGITPGTLHEVLTTSHVAMGFTSRVVFVYAGKKKQNIAYPVLSKKQEILGPKLQNDLEEIHKLSGEFSLDSDFLKLYTEWYDENAEKKVLKSKFLSDYNGRRPTYFLKLCMLSSASRSDEMILTKEDFARTLAGLELTESVMPKVFETMGSKDIAPYLNEALLMINESIQIPFDKLFAHFMRHISKKEFENILEALERAGYIRQFLKGENIIIEKV